MAKRWTVAEAYSAIKSGDKEAREDIGRRFPLFATSTPEEILGAIDNLTARQVEAKLRSDDEDEEDHPAKEKVEKKKAKKKVSKRPKVVEDDDEDEEDDDDFLDEFLDDDDE